MNKQDKKIQNDSATIVVKLLGRMNHLTRQTKIGEKLAEMTRVGDMLEKFSIKIKMGDEIAATECLELPMNDVIMHCISIFNKMIDNFYCQPVRGSATLTAFCILKVTLLQFFPDSLFEHNVIRQAVNFLPDIPSPFSRRSKRKTRSRRRWDSY